jgi:DNA polymerase-1
MPLSSAESGLYLYTDRESELLNALTACCEANHVEIVIDMPIPSMERTTCSLDVEHDESGTFVGCGLYFGSGPVYYYGNLLSLSRVPFHSLAIIAHNGKGDIECLRQWGIDVKDEQLYWDTELISHISDSSRKTYGLKKLSLEDLNISYPSYEDIVGKRTQKQAKERRTLDKWPVEIVSKYNALDTFVTYKLYEKQRPNQGLKAFEYFRDVEKPISFILQKMENRGVRIDLEYLKRLKGDLENQKLPLENEIKNELGNINLNSPKQLLEGLNAKGIFPTYKAKASTDKRALATVSSPIVSRLLEYSELDTLLSSFVTPYIERGTAIVHPFFNQCGTRTGRLSCSNPNLLQIPRRTENGKLVRRMFIPRDVMQFGDCDFGQIEPRVMAHLSKDPVLCQMFTNGTDFHTFTAERLGIDRDRAKVLNLSVGYRATFKSVMSQLRCDKDEAQKQIDQWWNLFPTLRRFQDRLIYDSKRSGFCTTLLDRRIKVDNLNDGNSWRREGAERQLINNITQGSAAEVMKKAMIAIDKAPTSISFGLLVQVYDELLFESADMDNDMDLVKSCMMTACDLDVPLTVDAHIGPNWAECKG